MLHVTRRTPRDGPHSRLLVLSGQPSRAFDQYFDALACTVRFLDRPVVPESRYAVFDRKST